MPQTRHPTGAVAQRGGQVRTTRPERGRDPEEESRPDRNPGCVGKRHPIESQEFDPRKVRREERSQPAHPDEREQQSDPAANRRQQQTLRQHLANQTPAGRAERRAHRQLPIPAGGPRQQQVGDIGARNQQHERHRNHGDESGPLRGVVDDLVGQLGHPRAHPRVGRGMVHGQPRRDPADFGVGLFERRARRQPPQHQEGTGSPRGRRIGGERKEQIHLALALEPELGRQDAHHRVRESVEQNGPAHHRGVAIEAMGPEPMRQHHARPGPGQLVCPTEPPPQRQGRTEEIEQVTGSAKALEPLRALAFREVETGPLIRGEPERPTLAPPIEEVRQRYRRPGPAPHRVRLPDLHHPISVGIRERPPQQRIDAREHRDVDGDAECQGKRGDGDETGTPPETANGMPEVSNEGFHHDALQVPARA